MKKKILLLMIFLSIFGQNISAEDLWKITAYCSCKKCCGKNAKGITASGKQVKEGMVACNWLKFGTKINIENLGDFTVEDKGAKSLFGDKHNHIKHIDVYMNNHKEAREFGVKYKEVKIGEI